MVTLETTDNGHRLILRPNASLGWRGNLLCLGGLVAISTLIGLGMWLAGAWMILPFAGVELTVLAAALYVTRWRCQRQEVIWIDDQQLCWEQGVYRRQARWQCPRRYCWLEVGQPRHPWTPPPMHLRHRDLDVPLAAFLNVEDCQRLLAHWQQLGLALKPRPQD